MEIKTKDVIELLQRMSENFEVLANEFEHISARDLSYDLLWSLFENCKQLPLKPEEIKFLEAEMRVYLSQAVFFNGEKHECESSSESATLH